MRKLSKCRFSKKFAYCHKCKEVFIDDLPIWGSVYCPNKDCDFVLERGYDKKSMKEYNIERQKRT